ncbi:MAG: hypothetical protein RLZZ126_2053 [Pseudomonadota bacterium]
MKRECLKCGHHNLEATGGEFESCPNCGAIYSKVEKAIRQQEANGGPVSRFQDSTQAQRPLPAKAAAPAPAPPANAAPTLQPPHTAKEAPFVEKLRSGTAYSTYRSVVRTLYFIGMAIPVLAVIGFLANWIVTRQAPGLLPSIGFTAVLLFIIVFVRMYRDISLMLCDASDASIKSAELLQQLLAEKRPD